MRQLMWVRKLPGTSTKNANGGVSTAEPEKGYPKGQNQGV
jgi:hypothetical protein